MPAGMQTAGNPAQLQPSVVSGVATSYNYIGSQQFGDISLHEPEVLDEIVRRYGRDDLTGLLAMLGRTEALGNRSVVTHFEKDFIHGIFKVNEYTTSPGTPGATLTVATDYRFTVNQDNEPFLSTNTEIKVAPQKFDILQLKGGVELIVLDSYLEPDSTLATGEFSVNTLDDSDLPSIAAADEIIIKGTAIPEASRQRLSRNSRLLQYKNYMMRHRRDHKVTGTEYGEKIWVKARGKDGKVAPHWFLEGIYDEYQRFMNEKELMLMDGSDITSTTVANTPGFATVSKTLGMIQSIKSSGLVENWNTSTGITLAVLSSMIKKLNKFKGSKENALVCGINFRESVNKLFRQGDGADITGAGLGRVQFQDFTQLQGANKKVMDLDFDGMKYLGYKFFIKQINTFSDPTTYGAAGQEYEDLGLVIPMDYTVKYNDENDSSAERVPSMRVVYKKDGRGGSRGYKEWVTGMGEGVANTDEDAFNVHMLCEMLLEMFALNRYGIFVGV